jgi:hypothetical protein
LIASGLRVVPEPHGTPPIIAQDRLLIPGIFPSLKSLPHFSILQLTADPGQLGRRRDGPGIEPKAIEFVRLETSRGCIDQFLELCRVLLPKNVQGVSGGLLKRGVELVVVAPGPERAMDAIYGPSQDALTAGA